MATWCTLQLPLSTLNISSTTSANLNHATAVPVAPLVDRLRTGPCRWLQANWRNVKRGSQKKKKKKRRKTEE
ncbi:hypothetical protein CEXT_157891 [Caerostris extrusa]|uniref:Secreted protein n=1 Tax=Caerostris extrusa TaxID=172846 RepID=A0AAV4XVK1_CAEEX|nr:hypothetical protein CEXT_157891 [Caerostris extrusa]